MMWKLLFVACLAVGALAEYKLTEEHKEQARNAIREYCKKNGAEDKAEDAQKAALEFLECTKALIDPETIKKEIEEAKPNGSLDEVFKKYCDKSSELKTCIHTAVSKASPCLEASLKEHTNDFNNATDQLIDFVCYKDGDRIALFIAENGPECLQSKVNSIRVCAENLKDSVGGVENAKKLSLQEQCAKFDQLTKCVVAELEKCSTPTPANMAEALFKFVHNGSPCAK